MVTYILIVKHINNRTMLFTDFQIIGAKPKNVTDRL